MTTLIVLFNLKDGQSEADYEKWAKEEDIPTAGALASVTDFKVYRAEGIFGADDRPPYRYVEIIHITSAEALGSEVAAAPAMADIAAKFQTFADNPTFMVTERLG